MTVRETVHALRLASPALAASAIDERNAFLAALAEELEAHKDEVFAANREDMAAADEAGLAATVKKRLRYDEGKLRESLAQLASLEELPNPIGVTQLARELDEGLVLRRVSCPIGVIGVIFEARPDALIQIGSLCIKSGNAAILKGGKETQRTNRALFALVEAALAKAGLDENVLALAESHEEIDELLKCDGDVDLLIPRGSNAFVSYIMNHTKIPVMGHSAGVCHVYVDRSADQDMAAKIVVDAKTQYPAVCNAAETLLVDAPIAEVFLPKVARALAAKGARLRATGKALAILSNVSNVPAAEPMDEDEYGTEYGDYVMSCKVVDGVEEAVAHINRWGSHHTDSIVATDDQAAAYFQQRVDSAGVYRNCSTRFADGFRYGFGAEVGISTGKLHARGPVGLEGLETYKYLLVGEGHIVGDYASGKKQFHFQDLA
ncbi:MAG: glutamate-5-semialdehyde dehydrogenase [Atopobiaceae bacterium]